MPDNVTPLEFWPPAEGWNRQNLPPGTRFIARLTFVGGRKSPIFSGYRPSWWLGAHHDGRKAYNDAQLLLLGRDEAHPGETVEIALQPVCPEYWTEVTDGWELEMCEGSIVCGIATVLEVIE